MIWEPYSGRARFAEAVRHKVCGKRVDLMAPWPLWGQCECGAKWKNETILRMSAEDLDARFEAGRRVGENSERRIWVETGNSLHGLYTEETDPDDREGTLKDGRRWWCYDHKDVNSY